MAIGDVFTFPDGLTKSIVLLESVTAINNPPSGASAGLPMSEISNLFGFMPDQVAIYVESNAGSGVMTCTGRLWAYEPQGVGAWVPVGTGTDSAKGIINAGSAMGEVAADAIRHVEPVSLVGIAGSRLYFEVTAIGGASTSIKVYLIVRKGYPKS